MKIDKTKLLNSQLQLLEAGFCQSQRSWVVCAPTGAGKTLMAEWALQQAAIRGRRGVYLAPLKAIVEEKAEAWPKQYPEYKIGLFTGETTRSASQKHPTDQQFLLMTSEKLAAYLHSWKRHLAWLAEIDVVVIDEFHLLGDQGRGPTLESLIGRMQRINPFVRFVGLSATVPNAKDLSVWLGADAFVTHWRPVPLSHRILRFRKVSEKPVMLASEVAETVSAGGQVLVFVNSRRRSEQLATRLSDEGFKAHFYHAGLAMADRTARQIAMRDRDVDVLVSTSSLEMGVNFPARKVVVYDSYVFNGDGFGPLPVGRYLQCAGRAGRLGYDDQGEAVLFLPSWHKDGETYLAGVSEPVSSSLFRTRALQKEIITEVSSRLSISTKHLETNFASRTFGSYAFENPNLNAHVENLIQADLLKRSGDAAQYLSETPLGRIASQMDVSPATIQILNRFYERIPNPCLFDCILAICLCPELSPKLPFNFEQIDDMGDTLLNISSHLLNMPPSDTASLSPSRVSSKALLATVKTAVVLTLHTSGESIESLAERFDCYPMDITILKRNCDWMLATAFRVFAYRWRRQWQSEFDDDPETKCPLSIHEQMVKKLMPMIRYGLSDKACDFVGIKGIGAKRAIALYRAGITTLHKLAESSLANISTAIGLRPDLCKKIRKNAKKILADQAEDIPFDFPEEPLPAPPQQSVANWPSGVDPYRLRRALDLTVTHRSDECLRVEGGTEPHTICARFTKKGRRTYHCDCMDAAKGNLCKHIMRTRLELGDGRELLTALKCFQTRHQQPLRYALSELWMQEATIYDRYEERSGDYEGRRFLDRSAASHRWQR